MAALIQIKAARPGKLVSFSGSKSVSSLFPSDKLCGPSTPNTVAGPFFHFGQIAVKLGRQGPPRAAHLERGAYGFRSRLDS